MGSSGLVRCSIMSGNHLLSVFVALPFSTVASSHNLIWLLAIQHLIHVPASRKDEGPKNNVHNLFKDISWESPEYFYCCSLA